MLADVDNRMRVAQEEIFGRSPACCRLKTKPKVCAWQTRGVRPRVIHLDTGCQQSVTPARGIEAGMVFVNTQNVRDLPSHLAA